MNKFSVYYDTEGQEPKTWLTDVPVIGGPIPVLGKQLIITPLAEPVTLSDVVKEVLKSGGFYRDNVFIPYHAIISLTEEIPE